MYMSDQSCALMPCSPLQLSRRPPLRLLSALYRCRYQLEASLRNMLQIADSTPLVSGDGRLLFFLWQQCSMRRRCRYGAYNCLPITCSRYSQRKRSVLFNSFWCTRLSCLRRTANKTAIFFMVCAAVVVDAARRCFGRCLC